MFKDDNKPTSKANNRILVELKADDHLFQYLTYKAIIFKIILISYGMKDVFISWKVTVAETSCTRSGSHVTSIIDMECHVTSQKLFRVIDPHDVIVVHQISDYVCNFIGRRTR